MSQQDIEKIKETFNKGVSTVFDTATAAEQKFNETTAELSSSVRKGISKAVENAASAQARAEVYLNYDLSIRS
jgi:hypothetical protein